MLTIVKFIKEQLLLWMAWYSEFQWKDIQEVKNNKIMDIQNTKQFKRWLNIIFLFIFIYKFFLIIKYGRGECFVIFFFWFWILWLMKQFRYLSDVFKIAGRGSAEKINNLPIVLQIFIGLVTYDFFCVYMCLKSWWILFCGIHCFVSVVSEI